MDTALQAATCIYKLDISTVYDCALSTQDLVTASPNFDIGAFVPRLKESLTVINPFKRQFLISWITVLDRCPP